MIICKFGGSSVASEKGAKNIKQIILNNKSRKIVVVSALGKTDNYNKKVTDQLYECFFIYNQNMEEAKKLFYLIVDRYKQLATSLCLNLNFESVVKDIFYKMDNKTLTKDYLVSRGEYLSAVLYSKYIKATFLDAKDYIIFNKNGSFDYKKSHQRIKTLDLSKKTYVIGGFYGANSLGEIQVFQRGGSDITGAIFAKTLNAEIYENFTDVDGVYDRNPNIFENAKALPILNYNTACQMADAGNEVVHKSALYLLKSTNVILIVKNTFNFNAFGTVLFSSNHNLNNLYSANRSKEYLPATNVYSNSDARNVRVASSTWVESKANNTTSHSLFICVNRVKVICLRYLDNEVLQFIKEGTANKVKVFLHNKKYWIILNEVYVDNSYFLKIRDCLWCKDLFYYYFFSNVIINNENLKNIKKIKKKAKKDVIFAGFLAFKNNFLILCEKDNYKNLIDVINKYLQK